MEALKAELLKRYKKTLDNKSKWYADDIKTFTESMESQSKAQLEQRLSNMICLGGESASFNKDVEEIKSELDKGGMFDVGSMPPESALD